MIPLHFFDGVTLFARMAERLTAPIRQIRQISEPMRRLGRLMQSPKTISRLEQARTEDAVGHRDVWDEKPVALDYPRWMRLCHAAGLCKLSRRADELSVWLAKQGLLLTLKQDFLEPYCDMDLPAVCSLFRTPDGRPIDHKSVQGHGRRPLNFDLERRLRFLFDPEPPAPRPISSGPLWLQPYISRRARRRPGPFSRQSVWRRRVAPQR